MDPRAGRREARVRQPGTRFPRRRSRGYARGDQRFAAVSDGEPERLRRGVRRSAA